MWERQPGASDGKSWRGDGRGPLLLPGAEGREGGGAWGLGPKSEAAFPKAKRGIAAGPWISPICLGKYLESPTSTPGASGPFLRVSEAKW